MIRLGVFLVLTALLLVSCTASKKGGYYKDDGPPRRMRVDISKVQDAVPRNEPLSKSGNRPYRIFGKFYYPMRSARGYRERGIASWYGKKFHGRRTASGERYDMAAMSAAHRTLPLPSYVRVTNLRNRRSVVVRVNDRGPFHRNRLIDLSYAAAYKLGVIGVGTGLVEVTAVFPDKPGASPVIAESETAVSPVDLRLFLQVGAFTNRDNAENLRVRLERKRFNPVLIQTTYDGNTPIYRVRIGPLGSVEEGDRLMAALGRSGILRPRLVVE